MASDTAGAARFGRSQRFRLSPEGADAAAAYARMIAEARSGSGRAEFDAARKSWAAPRGLVPEDGLFLVEFEAGPRTLAEASRSLDGCGTTAREVKDAVQRLLGFGLLVPVVEAPPPAPPPRRHW
jgi:hypothetical protein